MTRMPGPLGSISFFDHPSSSSSPDQELTRHATVEYRADSIYVSSNVDSEFRSFVSDAYSIQVYLCRCCIQIGGPGFP